MEHLTTGDKIVVFTSVVLFAFAFYRLGYWTCEYKMERDRAERRRMMNSVNHADKESAYGAH